MIFIFYHFIFDFFKYKISTGITCISCLCFGNIAGDYPVQLIIPVDMCALIRLIDFLIVLIFCPRIFRLLALFTTIAC